MEKDKLVYLAMEENQYWDIIEKTCTSNHDYENGANLRSFLFQLDELYILKFYLRTKVLLNKSYIGNLWCAAYIADNGCGDSEFEVFRCWLITRGKTKFYQYLEHPDDIVDEPKYEPDGFVAWEIQQAAQEIFYQKVIDNFFDYFDFEKFEKLYPHNPANIDLEWESEAEMKKRCPKLFAKYWGK